MRTQSIDYIVKLANTYLSLHPSLRQGESLYLAAYNYLEDYGTVKEKEHFDSLEEIAKLQYWKKIYINYA